MRSTSDTENLIASSGLSEAEIQALWLKMHFGNEAEKGAIPQTMVWHILSLSSELYPEEMLDDLRSSGYIDF